MIVGFKCGESAKIFEGKRSRKFSPTIYRVSMRKLWMLDGAVRLEDLRVPPANGLEKLKGKRKEQHSIRINKQWRICFSWRNGNAHDVEIVDYH